MSAGRGGAGHRARAPPPVTSAAGNPLQAFLDPECHQLPDQLAELPRLDGFCAAFAQDPAELAGRFIAKRGFPGIEFPALLAQLVERIARTGFGPGHCLSFRWPWVPSVRDSVIVAACRKSV